MTSPGQPRIPLAPERLAAWRLTRQHLGPAEPATGPGHVAVDLVGVQAQVPSAAAIAIAIRTGGSTAAVAEAIAGRRLVRAWAMRGTLHLFEADDYPVIVAALRRRETWRRPVWFRHFEVSEAEMEAIIEGVGEILDDGRPRTRVELSRELGAHLGRDLERQLRSSWGTLLKPAAERGYLIHAVGDGATVTFTRPDRWLGRWRAVDPELALVEVLRRYLAAYGPASEREILRWWGGLKPGFIRPALVTLAPELVEVDVDGARAWGLAGDVAAIAATPARPGEIVLLGPFDPLVVGAGARDALIAPAQYGRVSRAAGWISPVVLDGGQVAGVWESRLDGGRLELTVELFRPGAARIRRAIGAAADRVAAAQGLPAVVRFGAAHAASGRSIAAGPRQARASAGGSPVPEA